jgi:hypothetical protein
MHEVALRGAVSARLRRTGRSRSARWTPELRHADAGLDRLRESHRREVVALRLDHQADGGPALDVEHAVLDEVALTAVSNQL